MENKNNSSEILLKALEDFKSQYPMLTSGDLQTFVIGWNKAVELLSLSTNEEYYISWWNNLGANPLLRLIKQGELVTKYYGQQRRVSSLKDEEIRKIYYLENIIKNDIDSYLSDI